MILALCPRLIRVKLQSACQGIETLMRRPGLLAGKTHHRSQAFIAVAVDKSILIKPKVVAQFEIEAFRVQPLSFNRQAKA